VDKMGSPTVQRCLKIVVMSATVVAASLSISAGSSLDLNNLLIAATPVLIAACAHSLPMAVGGQGLSAGAMVLLSATIVTALPSRDLTDVLAACALSLLAGGTLGGLTGWLVGKYRARSSVVTLSVGAASTALSLDVLNRGSIPSESALYEILFGAQLFGISIVPLAVVGAVTLLAHRTLRGLQLGRQRENQPEFTQIFQSYIAAGLGSATAGIFLGGSLGFLNASMGVPILLQIIAAVALGRAALSATSGHAVFGSLCGGGVIVLSEFVAVQWQVPEFLSTSIDACWLIAALAIGGGVKHIVTPPSHMHTIARNSRLGCLLDIAVLAVIAVVGFKFADSDLIETIGGMFLLAVGQTAVVRLGYLDLSMPAFASFASTAAIALAAGQDHRLLAVVPCLLLFAVGIGLVHGATAHKLQSAATWLTIATAGVIQSCSTAILFYSPGYYAPSLLLSLAEHRWTGLATWALLSPVAIFLAVSYGVIGSQKNSSQMKALAAYVVSATCSTMSGILLAGLNGAAHYTLVDVNTFPALAVAFLAVNCARPSGTFIGAAAFFAIAVVVVDSMLISAGAGYALRTLALAGAVMSSEIKTAVKRLQQTNNRLSAQH
jgi:ribose transport system permease protein